jgi:hypothetical protein
MDNRLAGACKKRAEKAEVNRKTQSFHVLVSRDIANSKQQ